jgi:hypothetical protein
MELSDAPEKNPQWIDPETLRLVAQYLNHYATPGPTVQNTVGSSNTMVSIKEKVNVYLPSLMMKVPDHLYV